MKAKHRAWIEFGSATLGEAWAYLNAKDHITADLKATLFKEKLAQLEKGLGQGPYFGGDSFGMVDVVFVPIFRYSDILEGYSAAALFAEFHKVNAWRRKLSERASVIDAVPTDYSILFQTYLQHEKVWLMNET